MFAPQTAAAKAKQFLPFLQRSGRQPAVVDYVLSGHRFKLIIPKESVAVAFSLAGVRCPGKGDPYADEAMAFMRRRISQRSVEVTSPPCLENGHSSDVIILLGTEGNVLRF